MLAFVVLFGGKVFVCFNAACGFVVRLGFVVASLLVVLLVYAALYWASLAVIPRSLIIYWASVNTTGLRPVLNMPMLIIYLTSPFNAYEALMFHYPPWLYFIESVVVPTVILATEVVIALWALEYVLGRVVLSESFLTQSFALAFVASYMTSLIAWVGGGKPSIGTSIYTEYVFAATVYVAVVSAWDLPRRLVVSKNTLVRVYMGAVITAIVMPALVAAYLATELLLKPPIPTTHIAGLIPTVTLIVTHHKLTTTNKTQRHQGTSYRDMVIGIFIAIIVVVVVILWGIIWFRAHRVPASYIILFIIFMMPYVALIAIMIMKYLPQVPPLRWFLIFVGANYLIYLFSVSSLAFTLVGVGMLPPLPLLKGSAPSVVNAILEEYVLLNCHGTNFFNSESLNKAASISLTLSQSLINLLLEGILPTITILWLSIILPLRKLLNGNKEKAYDTLCRGDRLLLYSYIVMTLITYLSVSLSVIVYSLAILSSSEFPYAYAMLITTFLVLIVETLMIRNGGASSPWPWVALYISVISSLLYTVVAFYISGFILPSTCLTGVNDVLGIYESSLPLAGIFGAIPYTLTLLIIHHRIMCPRAGSEEK